jgi:histone H2A
VLEYLTAELLELAGNVARDFHKARITPRHLALAAHSDGELARLLHGATIAAGGVVPHIEQALLGRGRGKERKGGEDE